MCIVLQLASVLHNKIKISNNNLFYDVAHNYEGIKDLQDRMQFLELGEEWWWGTNRMIPINIIFKNTAHLMKSSSLMNAQREICLFSQGYML